MSATVAALTLVLGAVVVARPRPAAAAGDPYMSVSPAYGSAGTSISVRGSNFGIGKTIEISIDGTRIGEARTDLNGNFSTRVTVPKSTAPGDHRIAGTQALPSLAVRDPFYVLDPARLTITQLTGLVYNSTSTVDVKLDVYEPTGGGPYPAAVVVHGGDWQNGSRTDLSSIGAQLAQWGVVAYVVDYRMACHPDQVNPGVDPKLCYYPFPTPPKDVATAVYWVRRHGGAYRSKTGKVGVIGSSAGGNLAMEVGVTGTAGSSRADAVVAWSGMGDLTLSKVDDAPTRENYVGCSYTSCPDQWVKASPARMVNSGDAPLYLSGGSTDPVNTNEDQQHTINAWKAAAVPYQWHVVSGECHALDCLAADSSIFRESVSFLAKWLA